MIPLFTSGKLRKPREYILILSPPMLLPEKVVVNSADIILVESKPGG